MDSSGTECYGFRLTIPAAHRRYSGGYVVTRNDSVLWCGCPCRCGAVCCGDVERHSTCCRVSCAARSCGRRRGPHAITERFAGKLVTHFTSRQPQCTRHRVTPAPISLPRFWFSWLLTKRTRVRFRNREYASAAPILCLGKTQALSASEITIPDTSQVGYLMIEASAEFPIVPLRLEILDYRVPSLP